MVATSSTSAGQPKPGESFENEEEAQAVETLDVETSKDAQEAEDEVPANVPLPSKEATSEAERVPAEEGTSATEVCTPQATPGDAA